MKASYTKKTNNKAKNILFFIFFISSVSLYACSFTRNEDSADNINYNDNEGKRTLVFHENGKEWEVKLEDNEITSLSKDGRNIPENEIPKYKDFIQEKIREIDKSMGELQAKMDSFDADMEHLQGRMDSMNEVDCNVSFDNEAFRESMEDFGKQMQQAFNSDEFRESMKMVQENLKNIKIDVNLDQLHKELQNIKVNVDLSNLDEQMAHVKSELKNLKFNYKEKGLRKYNLFMNDLKEELEKDGFIDNVDIDFDMEFNSRELIIDGEKVPDEYHQKYVEMYEKRFDMKMDDDMNIKTNE